MTSARDIANAPLPEDATLWDRRVKALTLRNAGATYARIAVELGITETVAKSDVKAAIKEVVQLPVDQMVDRQRAVLLDLTRVNYHAALSGDREAATVILRCLEHEAKLYGLYAPARVSVGISESEFGRQAAELLRKVGSEPLRELAGLPATPGPDQVAQVIDAEVTNAEVTDEGWSNL